MNQLDKIKQYLTRGMTPENVVTKLAGNNPVMQDLIKKVKNGQTKEVETFVRNVYTEKGINFDEEYSKLKNFFS